MAVVSLILLLIALAGAHVLVGGTVPAYALPAYTLCGLAALAAVGANLGRRPLPLSVPLACGTAFALGIAVRAWFSPVEYLARADLACVLACLAVYLLVALVFTSARWRTGIAMLLMLLGLGSTGIGVYQFLYENNWMPFGFERADYGARASGFYICPNHTAGFLETTAMLGLGLALFGRFKVSTRLLIGYLSLILVVGVVLTASRGGYLSTLCGLVTLALLTLTLVGKRRPALLLGVFLAVALVGAGLLLGAPKVMHQHKTLSNRLHKLVDTRNNRVAMWRAALDQYRQAPVFGTGAGTYLYYGRYFRPEGKYREDPIHAHGDYLELLGEYGTVGGILALALLLSHGIAGLQSALGVQSRRLPEGTLSSTSLALTVGALAALATQIAHAVVDFNLHIPANALAVAGVLGILANPGIASSGTTGSRHGRGRRLALAATGLAALAVSVRHIVPEWHHEKARVAMAQERWVDAAEAAKRGLRFDPRNSELHGILGEARLYRSAEISGETVGRLLLQGARLDLERALALFPGDIWRWLALGQTLDALGQHDAARIAYDQAIANAPTWDIGYAYLGLHLERLGRNDEALWAFSEAGRLGDSGRLGSQGLKRLRQTLQNTPNR